MISYNYLVRLYLHVFGLPRLSIEPELTSVFFNENNQLLQIPQKIKDFKYLSHENPILQTTRMTNFLFPDSTIIELVPIALSPNNRLILLTKILTPLESIQPKIKYDYVPITELYNICKNKLTTAEGSLFNETEASRKIGWRLMIHREFVKPVYYLMSNLIIKNLILKFADSLFLNDGSLVCDVACGYDNLAIEIAQKYKSVAILNDMISKPIIKIANERVYEKTLFTNTDSLSLNLGIKADLLICKNVLHHYKTIEEIEIMFDRMSTLSNVLVIVDPEDPKRTLLGRFWNFYYRQFLFDQGERFISFLSFSDLILKHFSGDKIIIKKVRTIKGPFMVAFVDKRK